MLGAAIETARPLRPGPFPRSDYQRIGDQRGKPIANALARKIITLVFYALREGHIRCLDAEVAARTDSDTARRRARFGS